MRYPSVMRNHRFSFGLAGTVVAVAALAVAACGSGGPDPSLTSSPRPLACAWYTPTTGGQQAIVAVTGPACGTPSLMTWVEGKTRLRWISTSYITGMLMSQFTRDGTTVRIYQTGWALATQKAAGYLGDDFEWAGWGDGAVPVPVPS
jgi:hypothetical protein